MEYLFYEFLSLFEFLLSAIQAAERVNPLLCRGLSLDLPLRASNGFVDLGKTQPVREYVIVGDCFFALDLCVIRWKLNTSAFVAGALSFNAIGRKRSDSSAFCFHLQTFRVRAMWLGGGFAV